MKKGMVILSVLVIFLTQNIHGQKNEALFARLQGLSDGRIDFFNVGRFNVICAKNDVEFSAENSTRIFTDFVRSSPVIHIEDTELTMSDDSLGFNNYYYYSLTEVAADLSSHLASYYVESRDDKLIKITFMYYGNQRDVGFERKFINLYRDNLIPQSILTQESPIVRVINFAGREISIPLKYLGKWETVNNLRTFGDGQISWSVHENLEEAAAASNHMFIVHSFLKEMDRISDTTVQVIFEGVETTARKAVYQANTLLRNTLAGKRIMTVYYVAAPVRGNFVSCRLTLWDTDQINESGLPFLLEQVMELK